jgi:hypothetical protein
VYQTGYSPGNSPLCRYPNTTVPEQLSLEHPSSKEQ